MKTVLFHRNFRKFQGGHLKVFHYFQHVLAAPGWNARVRFSPESAWDERNPWRDYRPKVLDPGEACSPDALFLGGTDWRNVPEAERDASPVPILNFIQHVRHGFDGDPRRPFLRHRALRICCSEEAAESIRRTGEVNGPIFVIPYGLDPGEMPQPIPFADKDVDLLIVAIKQPALGRRLRWRLWRPRRRVVLLSQPILRRDFLRLVNRARVTLFLPHETEGFYIPALEGMALDTLVVCPDCVGNRSFCLPERNCFRPEFSPRAMRDAVETALRLSPAQAAPLVAGARETFSAHDLAGERRRFHAILAELDELWRRPSTQVGAATLRS
jgi:glycosyltransferase involved in cell wall biosynthesis